MIPLLGLPEASYWREYLAFGIQLLDCLFSIFFVDPGNFGNFSGSQSFSGLLHNLVDFFFCFHIGINMSQK